MLMLCVGHCDDEPGWYRWRVLDDDRSADEWDGRAWIPDYRDPATAGCLTELLGPDYAIAPADGGGFDCWDARDDSAPICHGATRGEAIARAIVAAGRCAGGES
jgi:hypothetical protein